MHIYTTHFYYPVTESEPNILILISFSFFYIYVLYALISSF